MVEHWSNKPRVMGSSPIGTTFVFRPGRFFSLCTFAHRLCIVRSYHGESTGSHPNSEVKHHWACSVLRWGTTRESQVMYVLLFPAARSVLPSLPILRSCECAIGLVVKYFVANEVPRVRFPDGAFFFGGPSRLWLKQNSEGWFRSTDLWVMSPTRFRCATSLFWC